MEVGFSRYEHQWLVNNLCLTYFTIAKGLPDTLIVQGQGWTCATNPFPHPICNFAICEDCAEIDTNQLKRAGQEKGFFNVYVSHFGREDHSMPTLEKAGFQRLYVMDQMARRPSPTQGSPSKIEQAFGDRDRRRVAEFMTWQFFSTQTPAVRDKICAASLSSPSLKLYETESVEFRSRPAGAVMLHRTEGVLGLYNLCVSVPLRKKGHGSGVVYAVEELAMQESVILGLQCDPVLSHWYEDLGLDKVGSVDVYSFRKF